jgi:glycerol uptake facilitator protein
MTNVSARRLGAEALGALILTLFGGAAVIVAAASGFAPNLLGPLAFGFALLTAVSVVGPVSGGHVNPFVTLAFAVRGRFPWAEVPAYVIAQLVGGIVAGALLFFTFGQHTGITLGHLAMTSVPAGVSTQVIWSALLAEALGTFLLCYAVLSLTDPDRDQLIPVALGIGLALATGALAFGGVTGGSFNFARTFGPDFVAWLAGAPGVWAHLWIYLLGPAVGAVAAAYLNRALSVRRVVVEAPAPRVVSKSTPKQKTR